VRGVLSLGGLSAISGRPYSYSLIPTGSSALAGGLLLRVPAADAEPRESELFFSFVGWTVTEFG